MDRDFRYYLPFLLVIVLQCIAIKNTKGQLATQVGIGALYINGDVDHVLDPLNSIHLGIRKNFQNNLHAEVKIGLAKATGLSGIFMESAQNGGGLVEEVYAMLGNEVWYPNYLTTYTYLDLSANYELQTGFERLRLIGGVGLGISTSRTNINLFLGENNLNYTVRLPKTTTLDEAKSIINRRYDATYETPFREGGFVPHLTLQLGLQFKITRGVFFSADVRHHLTTSDYLDPIKNISATQDSGNNDSVSMFTIGFIGYLLQDQKESQKVSIPVD